MSLKFIICVLLLSLSVSIEIEGKPEKYSIDFNDTNVKLQPELTSAKDLQNWWEWISNWGNKTGKPLNLNEFPGADCLRPCELRNRPRLCYFKWFLEHFHAMGPACGRCLEGVREDCYRPSCITGDGIEKAVMSINRLIPGPQIHVCKNDLIVVDVANHMSGTAATIHWHGLHQRDTPHMDGVPFVTQCPIEFSNTFRYAFWASQPGTQFYHSHTGHHKANGHYGALIIREPKFADRNSFFYDFDLPEHTIVISDWNHELAETMMPGLPSRGGILPDNVLINGKGTYFDISKNRRTNSPLEVFRIKKGGVYRFRFINAASHVCPIHFQIEHHRMLIIASDSYSLQPEMVDTLISTSGERYDFVVSADQNNGDFWIRVRAIGSCEIRRIEQFAILSYANTNTSNFQLAFPMRSPPTWRDTFNTGVSLNHPNTSCYFSGDDEHCISDLQSYDQDQDLVNLDPDHRFFLAFDVYVVNNNILFSKENHDHFMNIRSNVTVVGAINNLTFTFPPFSLLTQSDEINSNTFCDDGNRPQSCNGRQICPCIHRIKIKTNAIVELVIVDETKDIRNLNHPFHLHGYQLHLMGMGQHPLGIPMTRQLARKMTRTRSLGVMPYGHIPPLKDTVSVPSRGYTIVRFRANNPGFWLMHCHFEWHTAIGMTLVLQVGETNEMVKPPNNFPKCGNFLPDIDASVLRSRRP